MVRLNVKIRDRFTCRLIGCQWCRNKQSRYSIASDGTVRSQETLHWAHLINRSRGLIARWNSEFSVALCSMAHNWFDQVLITEIQKKDFIDNKIGLGLGKYFELGIAANKLSFWKANRESALRALELLNHNITCSDLFSVQEKETIRARFERLIENYCIICHDHIPTTKQNRLGKDVVKMELKLCGKPECLQQYQKAYQREYRRRNRKNKQKRSLSHLAWGS